MAADSYTIREAQKDEQSSMLTFLGQHYFYREYVNMAYLRKNKHRIDEAEKEKITQDVKNKYNLAVTNLPGLIVVHNESKEIVGMNLILIEENPNFFESKTCDKIYAEKLSAVPRRSKVFDEIETYVLKPLTSSVDIFSEYPSHRRALKLMYVCVNPEHSGRGLATKLVQENVRYAEKNKIGIVYGFFMSQFSQKAASKIGFQKISSLDIFDLRGIDGNVLFQGEEPHTVLIMAKQVQINN